MRRVLIGLLASGLMLALVLGGCRGLDEGESDPVDSGTDTDTETGLPPGEYGDLLEMCWVSTFGSATMDSVDSFTSYGGGSMVVSGELDAQMVFGAGEDNETTIDPVNPPYKEGYHASYNSDGTLAWAKNIGASTYGMGSPFVALTPTDDNGFLAAGSFQYTAVLGAGESNETTLEAILPYEMDLVVAQYGADGSLSWARRDGGTDVDEGVDVAMLEDGSFVFLGEFRDNALFGEGEPNESDLEVPNNGSAWPFLARYNADGTVMWAMAEGQVNPLAIANTSDDLLVVVGSYSSDPVLGVGQPNETPLPHVGQNVNGGFVAAFDVEGELQWAYHISTGGSDPSYGAVPASIAALPDETFIVSGSYRRSAQLYGSNSSVELEATTGSDELADEMFVARYSTAGEILWAKTTSSPQGRFNWRTEVEASPAGGFMLASGIEGVVSFDVDDVGGSAVGVIGDEAADLSALVKYTDSGELDWVARVGIGYLAFGPFLSVLDDGTAYMGGGFSETAEFLLADDSMITVDSQGDFDGFVAHVCHDVPSEPDFTEDCPMGSGVPCPCDAELGDCDDGSACLENGFDVHIGFCSNPCEGPDDTTSCTTADSTIAGYCGLPPEITDLETHHCIYCCELDTVAAPCPDGLSCTSPEDEIWIDTCMACQPPAGWW